MGAITYIRDRLTNVMSGMGTTADRSTYARYTFTPISQQEAEASYRSSWLMRKIVDIPPLDMTRAWRTWQTDKNAIEALEAEERRLALKEKCKRALILSRLWGGAAIVIGIAGEDASQPINPERVGKGNLSWLHVFSRHQLQTGEQVTDPESEWFGQPEWFALQTAAGAEYRIHPSRVITFVGQKAPEGSLFGSADWFWGDPLLQSIDQAVKNADTAQDGFGALIAEAKLDIIKIPGMMAGVGTQEYETRLLNRLGAAAMGKSVHRALMLDGEEEWEQKQVTWAGIPDIITSYLQIVAGAADIPITRLLGQSPKGLQSSGDGEERDYHAMVSARQDELLAPALDRIDAVLIRSAMGNVPSDIWYSFNPLAQLSAKDAAEIEVKFASAFKTYADTGHLPDDALTAIAKNRMIESGQWPGSEAAFEESKLEPDYVEADEDDLLTEAERKGGDPASAGGGGSELEPLRRAANDAAPPVFNITVPVEVHMPKGGGTRTVVTKHTEDGRIAEFEKHEIEDE